MIEIDRLIESSYHRTITIGGTKDSDQTVYVEVIRVDNRDETLVRSSTQTPVQNISPQRWNTVVTGLLPGQYRILAGPALDSQSIPRVIASDDKPLQILKSIPVPEKINTALDQRGLLTGIHRRTGEHLRDYRDVLKDSHLNPGSRTNRGMTNNLSRALRLTRKFGLVVTTQDYSADIYVLAGQIRWTCDSYTATERCLVDQSSKTVKTPRTPAKVFRVTTPSGSELPWEMDEDGRIKVDTNTVHVDVSYQYWKEVSYLDAKLTLGQLVRRMNTPCANSRFASSSRQGTCSAGVPRTGWPARYTDGLDGDVYRPCANGACPFYSAVDPIQFAVAGKYRGGEFLDGEKLVDLPAIQLVGDGHRVSFDQVEKDLWAGRIMISPVTIRPLHDSNVREALQSEDFISSPLRKIQEGMESTFRNVWGRAKAGSVVPSRQDEAVFENIAPIVKVPHRVPPEIYQSGVDRDLGPVMDVVVEDDGRWTGRVHQGYFWHGPNHYYLYGKKATASLADCAVLEFEPDKVQWFRQDGTLVSDTEGVLDFSNMSLTLAAQLSRDQLGQPISTAPGGVSFLLSGPSQYRLYMIRQDGSVVLLSTLAAGPNSIRDIYAVSNNEVWLLVTSSDQSGIVYRWKDGTLTSSTTTSTSMQARRLSVNSVGEVVVVGNVNYKEFDGSSWGSESAIGITDDAIECTYDADDNFWILGDSGEIFFRSAAGAWSQHPSSYGPFHLFEIVRTKSGLFGSGVSQIGLGSFSSTHAKYYENIKTFTITPTYANVADSQTITLTIHGVTVTFTVDATPVAKEFAKGANVGETLTNLKAAIEDSVLANFVSVNKTASTLTIAPAGGQYINWDDVTTNSCVTSATTAFAITEMLGSWLAEYQDDNTDVNYRRYNITGEDSPGPIAYGIRSRSTRRLVGTTPIWTPILNTAAVEDRQSISIRGHRGIETRDGGSTIDIYTIGPSGSTTLGELDTLNISDCKLRGKTVAHDDIIEGPGLVRIRLGGLFANNPGLWEQMRRSDMVQFSSVTLDGRNVVENVQVRIRDMELKYRLPSVPVGNGPVVVTNNMIRREDTYGDKTRLFSREGFFVDADRWLRFSRTQTLLENPSFEILDEKDQPEAWRFVDHNGVQVSNTSLAYISHVEDLHGVAFRGTHGVVLNPTEFENSVAIETDAIIEAADIHTVSIVAKKARKSNGALYDSNALVPMQIQLIPLNDQGNELQWPASLINGQPFNGWSDVIPLSNRWSRYSFTFGHGVRRLPSGTKRIKIRFYTLGGNTDEDLAIMDAAQLESNPVATDFVDRPYGFGDDLTIEWETSEAPYELISRVGPEDGLHKQVDLHPAISPVQNPQYGFVEVLPVLNRTETSKVYSYTFPVGAITGTFIVDGSSTVTGNGSEVSVVRAGAGPDDIIYPIDFIEGYLQSGDIKFTPESGRAWRVGWAFGDPNRPWKIGVDFDGTEKRWFLRNPDVELGFALSNYQSTAFTEIRIEVVHNEDFPLFWCYIKDGGTWYLDATFTWPWQQPQASLLNPLELPSGFVGLLINSAENTTITLGTGVTMSYSVSDTRTKPTRVDDWNPFYDLSRFHENDPKLKWDKTLHRAAVPYAQVNGAHKLRWLKRFDPIDSYEEITIQPGQAPTSIAQLDVTPSDDVVTYRQQGQRVRLQASVRGSNGHVSAGEEVQAEITVGGLGRLVDKDGKLVDKVVSKTNEQGVVSFDYAPPANLAHRFVKVANTGTQTLDLNPSVSNENFIDLYANDAVQGAMILAPDKNAGVHNRELGKLVDDADAEISATPLYQTIDGVVVPYQKEVLKLQGSVTNATTIKNGSTVVNDRMSVYALGALAVNHSVRMLVGSDYLTPVNSLADCYRRPGTMYVEYGTNTQVYYHTTNETTINIHYLKQFLTRASDSTLSFDPTGLGLSGDAYIEVQPDLKETVRISVPGMTFSSKSYKDINIINTVAPRRAQVFGQAPQNLKILFDRQLSTALTGLVPGSGDSLRVHFQWENPSDTTNVAKFSFYWQASGPTGFYNQYPASMDGPDQAGSWRDKYMYLDDPGGTPAWVDEDDDYVVYYSDAPHYDVLVRAPGDNYLDDTLAVAATIGQQNDAHEILINRLTPFAGASKAGEPIVWEAGGIDKAVYRLTVMALDSSNDILGQATVEVEAPDLTPPIPPAVYPDAEQSEISLSLRDGAVSIRPGDDTDNARYLKNLMQTGAVKVSLEAGSLRLASNDQANPIKYLSAFWVAKVDSTGRIYDRRNIGDPRALFITQAQAELHGQGQSSILQFTEDQLAAGHSLILGIPEGETVYGGTITAKISHALTWVQQLSADSGQVMLRFGERNYLRRNVSTGLLEPSLIKEVLI